MAKRTVFLLMGACSWYVQVIPAFGKLKYLTISGQAIAACLSNKRTFLSDPAWLTVPWTEEPKSPRDDLIDILVQIPALFEDIDILALRTDSRGDIISRIRGTYTGIDADPVTWRETKFPRDQRVALQALSNRIPTSSDFWVAHLLTLFWTACLVTHNMMRVASTIAPEIWVDTTLPEECSRSSLDSYCENITSVVDVLFHPTAGVFGSQFALFPVSCSLLYLTTTQQLKSETADKLLGNFSAHRSRQPLQKFVLGVVREWPGLRAVAGSSFPSTS